MEKSAGNLVKGKEGEVEGVKGKGRMTLRHGKMEEGREGGSERRGC